MQNLKVLLWIVGILLGICVVVALSVSFVITLRGLPTFEQQIPIYSRARPTATPPSTLPDTITLNRNPVSYLAFRDARQGGIDIFVIQPDGTQLFNLTRTPKIREWLPQWSSDGRHVYFVQDDKDGYYTGLYRINLDGTGYTKLFDWGQDIFDPRVSPNQEWVAYSAVVGSTDGRLKCAIFKARLDGTQRTQLTDEVGGENPPVAQCDTVPQWSPDSNRILFISNRHMGGRGDFSNLYIMNSDGTDVTQITSFEGWYIDYAAWSPDGQRIAISAAPALSFTGDLYVMNADGTDLQQVTHTSRDSGLYALRDYLWFSWSPDSARLAFEQRMSGIGVLEINGDKMKIPLVEGMDWAGTPAWSPWLLPLEIVGSWSLDEGTGTTARDGSAYGYDGTLVGDPAWTTGHDGTALSFDGRDDYVLIANAPLLRITDTLTLSAWVYRPSPSSGRPQGLIARWTEGQRSYALYLQGQGVHFALSPDGSDVVTLRSNRPIPKGQWVHLAAVYDGTSMGIYVDGVLDAVQSGPAKIFSGDAPLTLGVQNLGAQGRGDFFEGLLDEVEVRHWAPKK